MPAELSYWTDLATGDIVIAKGRRDWSETTLADAVGFVIRSEDLGAPEPSRPLVFTLTGSLGDIATVLGEVADQPADDLVIVAGSADSRADAVTEIREVILWIAEPADSAGEALIDSIGRRALEQPGPIHPMDAVRRIADLMVPADSDFQIAARTCNYCPNRIPCATHTIARPA